MTEGRRSVSGPSRRAVGSLEEGENEVEGGRGGGERRLNDCAEDENEGVGGRIAIGTAGETELPSSGEFRRVARPVRE